MKFFIEKYKAFLGFGLLLIMPAVFIFAFIKEKEVEVPVAVSQAQEKHKFFVDISGQVNKPGVYEVEEGKIVLDLVGIAGGFSADADLVYLAKDLNLSRKLSPEEKIYIPQKGENESIPAGSVEGKININTASLEQLVSLSGIGESIAQKIIDARPFKAVEDLRNISGIGTAKFEEIKNYVTI